MLGTWVKENTHTTATSSSGGAGGGYAPTTSAASAGFHRVPAASLNQWRIRAMRPPAPPSHSTGTPLAPRPVPAGVPPPKGGSTPPGQKKRPPPPGGGLNIELLHNASRRGFVRMKTNQYSTFIELPLHYTPRARASQPHTGHQQEKSRSPPQNSPPKVQNGTKRNTKNGCNATICRQMSPQIRHFFA